MVNVKRLKGKIVEYGISVDILAKEIGINKSTLYRKINSGGGNITVSEVKKISGVLKLSRNEIYEIFFLNENSQICEKEENRT